MFLKYLNYTKIRINQNKEKIIFCDVKDLSETKLLGFLVFRNFL